jgi:hypothetical protein
MSKIKKHIQFVNESKKDQNNLSNKLSILKKYIQIIDDTKSDYYLAKKYFIILYNFLIIEQEFFDDVVACGKQINKYLELKELNNIDEVYQKFLELYDTKHHVRFSVETFDSIESVRQYLSKHPEIYNKLVKKIIK